MAAELEGRTALVTGGGRGLGRAIALHLARAGARVALLARTSSQLEEAVAEIMAEDGRALPIVADVTDREARRWVPFLVEELETMIQHDPAPELERLGAQIVAIASGRCDELAGAYLDLEQRAIDMTSRAGS
jgi:NAD(P)-dependent dehydrogenase (short-subunit alcohol dehydrogenase family)